MKLADTVPSTFGGYLLAFVAIILLYFAGTTIYSFYFHPLAKFPGPKLAAINNIWYAIHWTKGDWPYALQEAHRKYGDVVRIAPNELSFATADSYKEIYGHASKGRHPFLKSSFYSSEGKPPSVVSARDPVEHSHQRKALSSAFSAKALRGQEGVVQQYVDMFVEQLGKLGGPMTSGLDITEAFNWVTFDIIGDLTFGESFDAVKNGRTHPWVSVIVDTTFWGNLVGLRRRLPVLNLILPFIIHKNLGKEYEMHNRLTVEKTAKRVSQKDTTTREDFFKHILAKEDWSTGKLESNAELLIVAGSETTATTLSGLMFFLMNNPKCMALLKEETRSTFGSYTEITGDSTAKLTYLNAVIEEGLRLYPPVAFGLPRISPGATVSGHYIPAGTLVSTQNWTAKRDPRYWHDPDSFRPDRWIGEGFGDRKESFNPFSLGPRACLGINLAYLELRVILAKMVWVYDWELVDGDVDWTRDNKMYVLWKKPTMRMRFHRRPSIQV